MSNVERLVGIMARLRDPEGGCPWDLEQDFASVVPYTLEEAYEVAEAVARGDFEELREELGDLLLQVVFHAQMAREAGHFDFDAVAGAICDKLVARHPHVFGDAEVADAAEQTRAWEGFKEAERRARRGEHAPEPSALDGVALALPALVRAVKLQRRARRAGLAEAAPGPDAAAEAAGRALAGARAAGDPAAAWDAVGEALFALAGLARALEVDPEEALRAANARFERRVRGLEAERRREPPGAASDDGSSF